MSPVRAGPGNGIAHSGSMARRLSSFLGIMILLALALTLLWQVYDHHRQADPYERDAEPISVPLDTSAGQAVKFAYRLS